MTKVKKVPVYLPSIGKAKTLLRCLKNSDVNQPDTEEAIHEGIRRAEKKRKDV